MQSATDNTRCGNSLLVRSLVELPRDICGYGGVLLRHRRPRFRAPGASRNYLPSSLSMASP